MSNKYSRFYPFFKKIVSSSGNNGESVLFSERYNWGKTISLNVDNQFNGSIFQPTFSGYYGFVGSAALNDRLARQLQFYIDELKDIFLIGNIVSYTKPFSIFVYLKGGQQISIRNPNNTITLLDEAKSHYLDIYKVG